MQARLDFPEPPVRGVAEALARAVGFGRASHDDLAQMAGHLSADTGDALGQAPRHRGAEPRTPAGSCEAAERRLDEAEQRAEPARCLHRRVRDPR